MCPSATETFPWDACERVLRPMLDLGPFEVESKRRFFEGADRRVVPPLILPIPDACTDLATYLDALPPAPGRQLVILMQAGAVSLGWFEGAEEQATKSFKRYVVRGKGRAQQTHLDAKGKSRYGSRLRLQNAQRLFEETNEKLNEWWSAFGAADQVFVSAPVRLWPSLFAVKPKPPFPKDVPRLRVPYDLPKPSTELLLRTYRRMCFGRIEPLE